MAFIVEGLSKHNQPKAEVRHIGNFKTLAIAIAVSKRTIDLFLQREYSPGTKSTVLFAVYQNLGEFPYIFRDDDKTFNVHSFNHLQYALERCQEICEGRKSPPPETKK